MTVIKGRAVLNAEGVTSPILTTLENDLQGLVQLRDAEIVKRDAAVRDITVTDGNRSTLCPVGPTGDLCRNIYTNYLTVFDARRTNAIAEIERLQSLIDAKIAAINAEKQNLTNLIVSTDSTLITANADAQAKIGVAEAEALAVIESAKAAAGAAASSALEFGKSKSTMLIMIGVTIVIVALIFAYFKFRK